MVKNEVRRRLIMVVDFYFLKEYFLQTFDSLRAIKEIFEVLVDLDELILSLSYRFIFFDNRNARCRLVDQGFNGVVLMSDVLSLNIAPVNIPLNEILSKSACEHEHQFVKQKEVYLTFYSKHLHVQDLAGKIKYSIYY